MTNKVLKGQSVTEQLDLINENVENINLELDKIVNNEKGYITQETVPVKSVQGKTGNVSLSAKDVGAFPNSSTIQELDINNIKDTGVYIGTYASNPYYLLVIKYNDTNIYQELIGLKFKQFRRFTGTWSEWKKEYSTENPVKAGDITGIELVDTDKELTLALLEDTTFVKADIKYNPSNKKLYVGDKEFATTEYVDNAVNMIKSIIVTELPTTGVPNTIYFVPSGESGQNAFNEFTYVNGNWEIVGGTTIDLTPFLEKTVAEQTYAKISSLDEKVSKTTTINGKTLYNNITLTAEDVGALSKDTILVEDVVYRHTNAEISGKLTAGAFVENDLVISIDDGTYLKGHMYKYNSGSLTDITDMITDYVDLNSDQNINGTKNFNGVLKYGGVGVATTEDIEDLESKIPSVDSSLSTTSANAVQNKIITEELNKKATQEALEEVEGKVDLKVNQSYVDDNFLPLTAGEQKAITGSLYVKQSSTDGYIFVGNGSCILGTSTGNLAISPKAGGTIYLRPQGTTVTTGSLAIKNGVTYPDATKGVSLGDSSHVFNKIYGTTIYQNGKQVANKQDIPTVNNGTLTIKQDGTTLGTFTANQSRNTTVNITGGGSGGQTIYDLVITTQQEFTDFYTSLDNGTCTAKSVLFVGDGGTLKFTRQDYKNNGLILPDTLKRLDGINDAIIDIKSFNGSVSSLGGISYREPKTSADYSINGLTLLVKAYDRYANGFYNCCNITNCKVQTYSSYGYCINHCKNVTNCNLIYENGEGGYMCNESENITNCIINSNAMSGCIDNCKNFSNCNITTTNNSKVFNACSNISNCIVNSSYETVSTYCQVFKNSNNISNCNIQLNVAGALQTFYSCYRICNCNITNTATIQSSSSYAIYNCRYVSNCSGSSAVSTFLGGTNTFVDTETVG